MHPAFSVIIFTTASGAGYGLLALTGFFAANGWLPADSEIIACAIGLALVLITGGLLAGALLPIYATPLVEGGRSVNLFGVFA